MCRRLDCILSLISLKGVHPNMAKNVFRKSVDNIYAGRCQISEGLAIVARRRCPESVFISPSLGVLVHHPPRRGPAKNHARLRFNSTGVDSPNART